MLRSGIAPIRGCEGSTAREDDHRAQRQRYTHKPGRASLRTEIRNPAASHESRPLMEPRTLRTDRAQYSSTAAPATCCGIPPAATATHCVAAASRGGAAPSPRLRPPSTLGRELLLLRAIGEDRGLRIGQGAVHEEDVGVGQRVAGPGVAPGAAWQAASATPSARIAGTDVTTDHPMWTRLAATVRSSRDRGLLRPARPAYTRGNGSSIDGLWGVKSSAPFSVMSMSSSRRTPNSPRM